MGRRRQCMYGFRSVVVITSASHAEGPRFDPGREHLYAEHTCMWSRLHVKWFVTCHDKRPVAMSAGILLPPSVDCLTYGITLLFTFIGIMGCGSNYYPYYWCGGGGRANRPPPVVFRICIKNRLR